MDWFDNKPNALNWVLRLIAVMLIVYPEQVAVSMRLAVGITVILFSLRGYIIREQEQQKELDQAAHYRGRGIGEKSAFLKQREAETWFKARLQAEEQHRKVS